MWHVCLVVRLKEEPSLETVRNRSASTSPTHNQGPYDTSLSVIPHKKPWLSPPPPSRQLSAVATPALRSPAPDTEARGHAQAHVLGSDGAGNGDGQVLSLIHI